jgi:hypothetical protein
MERRNLRPGICDVESRAHFISSTFRDMHAERDHLERVVFPELKERLRARRCLLEPIDLRVGVETDSLAEAQKELEVLKVCLAEIERSRPFLLVLLGDRYGWIPPEERLAAAAQEAGFTIDVHGRSVTALEIEYGILKKHPNQRRRSLFYFREPLPYAKMPPEIAARHSDAHSADPAVRAGFAKLQASKARVQQDGWRLGGFRCARICGATWTRRRASSPDKGSRPGNNRSATPSRNSSSNARGILSGAKTSPANCWRWRART